MLSVRSLRRPGLIEASFDVTDGECVAVRGASGSGKTLLLRAIADLDPSDGTVLLDDQSREAMPAPRWRGRVIYVPAEAGWWSETVGAHFPDWKAAVPLVEELGLSTACRAWPIERLSTGERQRLALIRALVKNPRVLLLDEPTSGLDSHAITAVEAMILNRLGKDVSVLWVTHDSAQADRVSGRCLLVDQGRVSEAAS